MSTANTLVARLTFTPNTILVTVEPVWIRWKHRKLAVWDGITIELRGWWRNTHRWVGRVAVALRGCARRCASSRCWRTSRRRGRLLHGRSGRRCLDGNLRRSVPYDWQVDPAANLSVGRG